MTDPMSPDVLRELLREAASGPTTGAFEALYGRVQRRRLLRRGTLLVLTAAAAAAAVAVPSALLSADGQRRSLLTPAAPTPSTAGVGLAGAVPWLDAPEPLYLPLTAPPTPPPATDARPCGARDVTATFTGGNGAGGSLIRYVSFRNVSSSACVLLGSPRVTASEPGQPDFPGTAAAGHRDFARTVPGNMQPGQLTSLALITVTSCPARPGGGPAGPLYQHISVAMPGGGSVALSTSAGARPGEAVGGLDLGCGLYVTAFFVVPPEAPQPHDPLTDLQVSLELPPTARAGSTLIYVADLTNPTDNSVDLGRCPGYLQWAPPRIKQTLALNCAPVGAIAAHRTVRFEMRMALPADISLGPLGINWQLTGPGTAQAKANVNVVAAPKAVNH